jgi:hypothetical protein
LRSSTLKDIGYNILCRDAACGIYMERKTNQLYFKKLPRFIPMLPGKADIGQWDIAVKKC